MFQTNNTEIKSKLARVYSCRDIYSFWKMNRRKQGIEKSKTMSTAYFKL